MKFIKIFIILIMLSACSLYEEPKFTFPDHEKIMEEIEKRKKLPQSFFTSWNPKFKAEEIEDFYNSDLGIFSYYKRNEETKNFTVTWNLLDGSEVYKCVVIQGKNQAKRKTTWCACNESEAYDRWLNGETELIRYQEEIVEEDNQKNEQKPIQKKSYEEREKERLERYQEMCNHYYVSDYLDLYDEFEQEFEDEDDAFDFYYKYCK